MDRPLFHLLQVTNHFLARLTLGLLFLLGSTAVLQPSGKGDADQQNELEVVKEDVHGSVRGAMDEDHSSSLAMLPRMLVSDLMFSIL